MMTSHSAPGSHLALISFQNPRLPWACTAALLREGLRLCPFGRPRRVSSSPSHVWPGAWAHACRAVFPSRDGRSQGPAAQTFPGTVTGKRGAGRRSRCLHSLTNWPGPRPHFPCSERVLAAVVLPKLVKCCMCIKQFAAPSELRKISFPKGDDNFQCYKGNKDMICELTHQYRVK